MRKQQFGSTIKIWLSANDTYRWAHKAGAAWPCSTLSGRRVFAELDRGDLVDLAIDGKRDVDCDGNELNAILADLSGGVA
jgi:hypothetical protein